MDTLYDLKSIRVIEQKALSQLPSGTLMERAGLVAYQYLSRLLANASDKKRILVLAGPGNNGGDALELAVHLANDSHQVHAFLVSGPQEAKSVDSKAARQKAIKSNIVWENALTPRETVLSLQSRQWDMIIDGMFGIGLNVPLKGIPRELTQWINTLSCPVIALDIPSGLNADTGTFIDGDNLAVKATHTITFLANKPGLYTANGRDYAGYVTFDTLGVDSSSYEGKSMILNSPSYFAHHFKKREHNSHKGTYGRLAIVGGDDGYLGALLLASRAALLSGTGLTYGVCIQEGIPVDFVYPEIMIRQAHHFNQTCDAYVVGPGLGPSSIAKRYLTQYLSLPLPLVLDADALNIIALDESVSDLICDRRGPTIMTPHPLEAARLLKTSVENIQANRIEQALSLSKQFNAIVSLKGSGTIIASPDNTVIVNPTGNPALATAGTGDVLAGLIGSFIVQGINPLIATAAANWFHGQAADDASKNLGAIGFTAGEIAPRVRSLINQIVYSSK